MKEIIIVVEGQTEEAFVNQVLKPYFNLQNIFLKPEVWLTNRKKNKRGGGKSWDLVENHLDRTIKQNHSKPHIYFSTMVDLYAFPSQGNTIYDDEVKAKILGQDKVHVLEQKMSERFSHTNRFIPYVQLHEFESLLFSDINKLIISYPSNSSQIESLSSSTKNLKPEQINDTPLQAPSKRILSHLPSYNKTISGAAVAKNIGLDVIRERCPHFNDWIRKLEKIISQ